MQSRPEDGHKGTFGHAMIIAGKYGMAGASVLAAKACLRSGVGKVTVHIPEKNNDIVQIYVPEAIIEHDKDSRCFTSLCNLSGINALAVGPGLGTEDATAIALHQQLQEAHNIPTVIDADALNILSMNKTWLNDLPENCILTPHVGELRRLADSANLQDSAQKIASESHCHVVMKGHPTIVYHPDKTCYVCRHGNDGMATAGSGDVLSGIIVSLLAQGYSCKDASEIGVTLHALSGDAAANVLGHHCMIASDIIQYLPEAFRQIENICE